MGPIYTSSTAALRRAFDIFDADGNGSIDRDEFSSIMHRLHLLPRDDERVVNSDFHTDENSSRSILPFPSASKMSKARRSAAVEDV